MKRITGLFCLLSIVSALFFVSSGAAQEVPQEEYTPPATVTSIKVEGNKAISTNVIVSKMKTRIGSPYQDNVISDDLKRLYLLGYFSDIKIDTEDYKQGLRVIVTVVERPIIEEITFTGNRGLNMREDKLLEALKSKKGQYLDYPDLAEDVSILKKMYEKRGFTDASIDYKVDIDSESNKAKVSFNVIEDKRIRIKNIFIKGNLAFSDGRILRLIKTKRAWLFNRGALKEDVLKEDIERIKAFYQREGFSDVAADFATRSDETRPFLYITITIREGKKYLVGSVNIDGNKEMPEKEILSVIKFCVPGKVFSRESMARDIASIQGAYFDRGYIFANVNETTSLNPHTGRVDITYGIFEQEVAYVDKIKVRGNVKTKDIVVRRELRIRPGDRFDGEKLRRSKEKLNNLGFFEEVSYDVEGGSASDKKDLVVEVKESKTGAFSFGGGYSSIDEFMGFVEIEQRNFDWKNFPYFTGAGQDLKLRASFGTVSQGYVLSFTEPWVFDYPVSFGFDLYKRQHDREEDVGYGYSEKVTGGDLRLGKEISDYLNVNMMYRYDTIDITDIAADASNDLLKEYGENSISSLSAGLSFDSRDNVFNPRTGNLLTGNLEGAGGILGGDKDFFKFFGRASHFFPMPRGAALELRGRLGLAKPYGDSDDIPLYERFFAGGSNTIRGYHERKIGPVDSSSSDPLGGESLIVANIEYIYPLFDFLKVAAFVDTGNVWAKFDDIGSGGFKSGLGLGARVKTPIGPIRVDYGIPLNKEPGEDERGSGRFHFSVSHGF
ncbi:outer membrane protein assembly factor BamA [Candidatus Omnitrophota bacterium]